MRTYFWIGTAELEETKYRSDLTGKWESLLHFFFFFLAAPHSMWDFSSPTRD